MDPAESDSGSNNNQQQQQPPSEDNRTSRDLWPILTEEENERLFARARARGQRVILPRAENTAATAATQLTAAVDTLSPFAFAMQDNSPPFAFAQMRNAPTVVQTQTESPVTDESVSSAGPVSPLNNLPTTSLTSPIFATDPVASRSTAENTFFGPPASSSSDALRALLDRQPSRDRPQANYAGSRTTSAASKANKIAKVVEQTKPSVQWPPYLRNPVRNGMRYPFLAIPTQWSVKDRSSGIDLNSSSVPRLRAYYTGPGEGDKDAAAVRADAPVYAPGGIYYFEITILSKGKEGYISIGLCGPKVALNRLPGKPS